MKGFLIKAVLSLLLAISATTAPHQTPVIGIYTLDSDDPPEPVPENFTYFAGSYVKNLEMAGAQVVPIFYHYS